MSLRTPQSASCMMTWWETGERLMNGSQPSFPRARIHDDFGEGTGGEMQGGITDDLEETALYDDALAKPTVPFSDLHARRACGTPKRRY